MKKQVIVLLLCVVLVAALSVGLYFLLQYQPESADAPTTQQTLPATLMEKTSYDLDTLVVQNTTERFVIKNLGEDKFSLEEITNVELKNSMLLGLANAMSNVKATDTVKNPSGNLADYGLASPEATLTATYTDGTSFTLLVGATAPGGSARYGKTSDTDAIYLFDANSLSAAFSGKLDLISTTITTDPVAAAAAAQGQQGAMMPDAITISGSFYQEPVVIRRDTDARSDEIASYGVTNYTVETPKKKSVDPQKSGELFPGLYALTATKVLAYSPTPQELTAFGLSEPHVSIAFSGTLPEATAPESITLYCSAADESGNIRLMREGVPLVYELPATSVSLYQMPYTNLLSSIVVLPFIEDVATVAVNVEGKTYEFALTGEGDTLKSTHQGTDVDIDRFKTFYQSLIGLPIQSREDLPESLPQNALVCSITYTYRDSAKPADRVELHTGEARKLLIALNGELEGSTRESYLTTVTENVKNLISGEGEVNTLY